MKWCKISRVFFFFCWFVLNPSRFLNGHKLSESVWVWKGFLNLCSVNSCMKCTQFHNSSGHYKHASKRVSNCCTKGFFWAQQRGEGEGKTISYFTFNVDIFQECSQNFITEESSPKFFPPPNVFNFVTISQRERERDTPSLKHFFFQWISWFLSWTKGPVLEVL